MGLWHVIYEDWQMECCGTPFAVGDEVSRPLLFEGPDSVFGGGRHDRLTEVGGPVEEVGGVRVVRAGPGLTVALSTGLGDDDARLPERGSLFRAAGLLSVERHGARWPEVRGRVREVQVLSQAYRETAPGSRTWQPVAGERRLRTVERCPEWFAEEETDRGRQWKESGVLAALDVPDGAPPVRPRRAAGPS
ncbi:DUF6578 domain-containing protein [Streptomyces sp. NPDC057837]|uniref:DUF6578 domain-containing protein n=1 Tax=Streptomyces sp. NPDC057837 TaxID=3346260 RepID=UPI0036C8CB40